MFKKNNHGVVLKQRSTKKWKAVLICLLPYGAIFGTFWEGGRGTGTCFDGYLYLFYSDLAAVRYSKSSPPLLLHLRQAIQKAQRAAGYLYRLW